MIAWMLYAAVIGALLAVSSLALERVAAARGLPMRFIWLASMIVSIGWAAASAVRRLMPDMGEPVRLMPFSITLEPTRAIAKASIGAGWAVMIDRGLIALWVAISLLLFARLFEAVRALRRTRGSWRAAKVDGVDVRLSSNVGPAVVGLRSMDVVLPEWIMTLDAPLRALVLRHEEEHRSARDPHLLFASAIAAALMPWNLALWFQAKRLRLAIEMDCDARVLRAHPSPERYGLLMLTIAQRRSIAPPMFAPMLSEPTSQLERRIIAMRSTTQKVARATVVAGTVIAAGVLLFACALQSDSPLSPKPGVGSRSLGRQPQAVNENQTYFEFQVEQAVTVAAGSARPRYPDVLRAANVEGEVLAQFVTDTSGLADVKTFKVLKSTHDLFSQAVLDVLPNLRFNPALVGGHKVKQLVQMPFQFNLSQGGSSGTPTRPNADSPTFVRARTPQTESATRPYVEFKLAKQATPKANGPMARYPDALRTAKIEGEVVAQFVVDEAGHVNPETLKILKSTHDLFTESVKNVLPMMEFNPAQSNTGNNVKQLVTMPFTFNLSK